MRVPPLSVWIVISTTTPLVPLKRLWGMPETEDTNASAFRIISGVALTTAESDREVVLQRREHITSILRAITTVLQ